MSIRIVVDFDTPHEEIQASAIAKVLPSVLPARVTRPQAPIIAIRNHTTEESGL